ncbi:hypothetical protein [Ekhidna sp.]|uniref:hypothetical protein n=1 Tax=Ekhidna sp. TaxID=2608089 RepID=UPI003296B78B
MKPSINFTSIFTTVLLVNCLVVQGTPQKQSINTSDSTQISRSFKFYLEAGRSDSTLVYGLRLGNILHDKNELDEALALGLKLNEIARKQADKARLAECISFLGRIYAETFAYTNAKSAFEEAYEIYSELEDAKMYTSLSNLAVIKNQFGDYAGALRDHKLIYSYHHLQGNKNKEAISLINIGTTYTKMEKYDSCLFYLRKSIDVSSEVKIQQYAQYYYSRALLKSGRLMNAKEAGEESLRLARKLQLPMKVAYSVELLSEINRQLGNYKKAMEYKDLSDSIAGKTFHQDYDEAIAKYKEQFESDEKDKEIELLNSDLSFFAAWNMYLLAVCLAVTLAVLGLFFYFRRKKGFYTRKINVIQSTKNIMASELENHKLELELKKKETTSSSLNLLQREKLLNEVKTNLQKFQEKHNLKENVNRELRHLVKRLDRNTRLEESWNDFRLHFDQISDNFSQKLLQRYPTLSRNELRLCCLIKLNLSIKELAFILNISNHSAKTARYRLRKKMGLSRSDNLRHILNSIDSMAELDN